MSNFVYVDNSNAFIEGKRVSAVRKGIVQNIYEAMNRNIIDNSYRLDFGKLHSFTAGSDPSKIKRAVLFGSRPPENDTLWVIAEKAGFEVVTPNRNAANKEKKVDTGIVSEMMRDAYKKMNSDEDVITLVAGDGDFVPAIQILRQDGYKVELFFWNHASQELKDACNRFVALDQHLEHLSF
ncbi:NYN domain-containing protein [Anabaena cylindrica UHCC 0172]|uniref:NYN domain-containing protein n=1 Tax=Anabaena cylindrica TaxID=1165 RepID=UPI002B20C4A3|nr:NYN domain-containing protein [Anabaena cylindrica]MEA5550684.1 NYN domain-containing protein [Anabaena cylindrica UHCC 0172]